MVHIKSTAKKQAEEKRSREMAERLGLKNSDPDKWIIMMEQQFREEELEFFTKAIRTLNLPAYSDGIVCLAKITNRSSTRMYILCKHPDILGLIIEMLRDNGLKKRLAEDRISENLSYYYFDGVCLDEKEAEDKIRKIIKSGLLELRSL